MSEHPTHEHIAPQEPSIEYRAVPGWPGYCVGSDGSLWSCIKRRRNVAVLTDCWHRMKWRLDHHGYHMVSLKTNGRRRDTGVHRLVLEAFVGPRDGMDCCHNDGDPSNNHISNLRWDTRSGNMQDRKRHGTHVEGERTPSSKLTAEQVLRIRAMAIAGIVTQEAMAAEFGVCRSAISAIVRRRHWRHL